MPLSIPGPSALFGAAAKGVDAPEVQTLPWGSFTSFTDPDGNTWTLQQLPPPGSYDDANDG